MIATLQEGIMAKAKGSRILLVHALKALLADW
jgi:hypothetical protein